MKLEKYDIVGYVNQPKRTVSGYAANAPKSDGSGDVKFMVRKIKSDYWVADHYRSGCAVSAFAGSSRKAVIENIKSLFAEYEERILRAEKTLEAINNA